MRESNLDNQAAAIFRRAADYIRTYGWQVTGMSQDGLPRCSMGALASAYKVDTWDKALAKRMYNFLYEELDGMSLTEFNYTYRDGEVVATLFDRVASKLLTSKNLQTS